jgi:outer membrane protein OmpA-like peptidoglycan-associated protein
LDGIEGLREVDRTELRSTEGDRLAELRARIERTHVLFAEGYELTAAQTERLDALAEDLRALFEVAQGLGARPAVSVIGRTDGVGTAAYNRHLGQQRAYRVAAYLSQQAGLAPRRLRTAVLPPLGAGGAEDPLLRRVEFEVRLRDGEVPR